MRMGVTDPGELSSLSDVGVVSISLTSSATQTPVSGGTITRIGGVTMSDGSVHKAESVWLTTDQTDTRFIVPEGFQMSPEAAYLPNVRGYGSVPDLNVAMSMDPTLMQMVKDLVVGAGDFAGLDSVLGSRISSTINGVASSYALSDFDHMLMRWAGTDGESGNQAIKDTLIKITGLTPNARSDYIGAFHIVTEEIAARFYSDVATKEPIRLLDEAATMAVDHPPADGVEYTPAERAALDGMGLSSLIGQAHDLLENDHLPAFSSLGYDIVSDRFTPDIDALARDLSPDLSVDPSNPWGMYSTWMSQNSSLLGVVGNGSVDSRALYAEWTGNVAVVGEQGQHVGLVGTGGNDVIDTDQGGLVFGDDGSISFTVPPVQVVRPGAGDDVITTSTSADVTVVLKPGDGNDVVDPGWGSFESSSNHIVFQGAVSAENARFEQIGVDLVIHYTSADSVTLKHYFDGAYPTVSSISFPDASNVDQGFIKDQILYFQATQGNDAITGYSSGSHILGLGGDDVLTGLGGDDIISGGNGDDLVHAGAGNDVIGYSAGDGNDTVWGETGDDTLRMGDDIVPSDVSVSGLTDMGSGIVTGVVLHVADGSIALPGQFDDGGVDHVLFADGTDWASADLLAMAMSADPSLNAGVIMGTMQADTLRGTTGDDILLGYDGNDDISSGPGGDDIIFAGAGDDKIAVFSRHATVFGGAGNDDIEVIPIPVGTYGLISDGEKHDVTIYAGSGDDSVWSGVVGGVVADLGDGNDLFNGNSHYEVVDGGNGDDDIRTLGGHDLVSGGAGNDTVEFDGEDKVDVDLSAGTVRYGSDDPVALLGFENVSGSSHNDHIVGDDGNNQIWGGYAEDGDDVLVGGAGDDFLSGNGGTNTLSGGDGFDSIMGEGILSWPGSHAWSNIIDGGSDYDTVYFYGSQSDYAVNTINGTLSVDYVGSAPETVHDTISGVEGLFFYGDYSYVSLASPIVVDLNGDGVKLVDPKDSKTSFDFDGDGKTDHTGWISPEDGILVKDINGNGKVDGYGEISFSDAPGARSDLDGLRSYDDNHDGVISSQDDIFATLSIWQDKNSNGSSDPGEMIPLSSLGISSISLSAQNVNQSWSMGQNVVVAHGSMTGSNISYGFDDVLFSYKGSADPDMEATAVSQLMGKMGHQDVDMLHDHHVAMISNGSMMM